MLTVSIPHITNSYRQHSATGSQSPLWPQTEPAPAVPAAGPDEVRISAAGTELSRRMNEVAPGSRPSNPSAADEGESPHTVRELEQLKARDIEVRSHEQAHVATAGRYARGGAVYTYQKGPDGKSYATGGEVPIDISAERTAEATIAKMQIIRRAALAPANPSAADRQIAAQASAKLLKAQQQLNKETNMEAYAAPGFQKQHTAPRPGGSTSGSAPAPEPSGRIRALMTEAYQSVDDLL